MKEVMWECISSREKNAYAHLPYVYELLRFVIESRYEVIDVTDMTCNYSEVEKEVNVFDEDESVKNFINGVIESWGGNLFSLFVIGSTRFVTNSESLYYHSTIHSYKSFHNNKTDSLTKRLSVLTKDSFAKHLAKYMLTYKLNSVILGVPLNSDSTFALSLFKTGRGTRFRHFWKIKAFIE